MSWPADLHVCDLKRMFRHLKKQKTQLKAFGTHKKYT
jgi:hypothetical protein